MEMILDANAIMAVIVKQPEREKVIQLIKGAIIVSLNVVILRNYQWLNKNDGKESN
jgi:PIN domain nuclease of toxin-antitoxin system